MRELKIFLTAWTFLTRVPIPWNFGWDPQWLHASTRWFPLVGLLIGSLGALILFGFQILLPLEIAILLSMLATIRLTGAFHEDGFADTCDGFGGGLSKEHILRIMKDSRLGTYGTVGLTGILGLKFLSLRQLPVNELLWALPLGHTLSRVTPVLFMATSEYVRDDDSAKSKPMGHRVHIGILIIVLIFALAGLTALWFWSGSWSLILIEVGTISLCFFLMRRKAMQKIGGFTGDVLGAMQQVTEVGFYLGIVVWARF